MKIVEKFTDLDKANAYLSEINTELQKESTEKAAEVQKGVLLQKSLDSETAVTLKLGKTIEGLEKNANSLQDLLTAAEDALEVSKSETLEALLEVAQLGEKLDLHEKHGSEGLIVMVKSKSYTLTGDTFIYGGSVKTALELSKDTAELERMVKIKSGALTELN